MDGQLTVEDLKVGHVYRGKRRQHLGGGVYNDREILYIGRNTVQYDSANISIGRRFPSVPIERFLKWVGEEVEAPNGD